MRPPCVDSGVAYMDFKKLANSVKTQAINAQEKIQNAQEQVRLKREVKNSEYKVALSKQYPDYYHVMLDYSPFDRDHENNVCSFEEEKLFEVKLSWMLNMRIDINDPVGNTVGRVQGVTVINPLRQMMEHGPRSFEMYVGAQRVGRMDYHKRTGEGGGFWQDWNLNGWSFEGKHYLHAKDDLNIVDENGSLVAHIQFGFNKKYYLCIKEKKEAIPVLLMLITLLSQDLHRP